MPAGTFRKHRFRWKTPSYFAMLLMQKDGYEYKKT